MEEGKYSEVFIFNKSDGGFSINQLRLDPFSAMLYSTKADEFQAVQELQKHGLSIALAIQWLANNKTPFKHLMSKGQRVKEAIASLMTTKTQKGDSHV
jgi:hypothetical protein